MGGHLRETPPGGICTIENLTTGKVSSFLVKRFGDGSS
jgi:hypothetical protein